MEFRAIIRKSEVTLVPRDNALVEGGPLAVITRAALDDRVSLANITWEDDDEADEREVHVEFLVHDNPCARRALKRWALATGQLRVWFADEVFEPGDLPQLRRVAHTKCRTCGLEMADSSEGFWDLVTESGLFPPVCFACGASVPQWSTAVARTLPNSGHRPRGVRLHAHESSEASRQDGGE